METLFTLMRRAFGNGIEYPHMTGEHGIKLTYMSKKDYIAIKIDGVYVGKITPQDGVILYQHQNLKEYITTLYSSPVETARIHGYQHGFCCFCNRRLDNAISVYHGYGPVCADNYGLPWEGNTDITESSLNETDL